METSSNYAVLVLEQPWWALDIDPEQTSVRHFLDGLSRLESLPIYYSTFFDSNSFGQALQYLLDARKIDDVKHLIVYVVVASPNMLNFSRFENAQSCSPHEAKRNARFWGAMHPSGGRRSRIPRRTVRATSDQSCKNNSNQRKMDWR